MNALIAFCAANWGYFAVALAAYIVKEGRRVQRGD
jgi:hypothetical protein